MILHYVITTLVQDVQMKPLVTLTLMLHLMMDHIVYLSQLVNVIVQEMFLMSVEYVAEPALLMVRVIVQEIFLMSVEYVAEPAWLMVLVIAQEMFLMSVEYVAELVLLMVHVIAQEMFLMNVGFVAVLEIHSHVGMVL